MKTMSTDSIPPRRCNIWVLCSIPHCRLILTTLKSGVYHLLQTRQLCMDLITKSLASGCYHCLLNILYIYYSMNCRFVTQYNPNMKLQ
jgi:hypothetical protein